MNFNLNFNDLKSASTYLQKLTQRAGYVNGAEHRPKGSWKTPIAVTKRQILITPPAEPDDYGERPVGALRRLEAQNVSLVVYTASITPLFTKLY